MEGSFETGGGSSGGSSMPDPGGSVEFNPSGDLQDSGGFNTSNSNFTHLDYLKDGVDKGYYKQDAEGIFSMEEVMSEAQGTMSENEIKWDVMDISGTAHEKLESLAEMSDEEFEGKEATTGKNIKSEKNNSNELITTPEKEELSFEQQIIKLQAETMKLMAQAMNSKVDKKELEELLKKLEELTEEADSDKEKSGKKANLLTGVFSAVLILLEASEKGYKMVENEVKEAEKV